MATALSLDRRLFTPHVAYVEDGFRADELRRGGIALLQLPLRSYINRTAWESAVMLRRYIREHRIRMVHTFDHSISIFAIPVSATMPGVLVLSSQRYYFSLLPRRQRWMMNLAHRLASGIVVNAESIRTHLVTEYGHRREKIEVCYNGIDIEQFSPAPKRRGAFSIVVGVVCVLRPEKNLRVLVEAFARVGKGNRELGLLVVGSGPEQELLEKLAQELGVGEQCRFQPSSANVVDYLREIDIFVHPSLSEGLPNAVMEAMACGCCVLSSNVGGSPEVLVEGESGFLFAPTDMETLTERLRSVIADRELRERLGRAAAERIRALFTTAQAARRMEEIYLAALERSQGAS